MYRTSLKNDFGRVVEAFRGRGARTALNAVIAFTEKRFMIPNVISSPIMVQIEITTRCNLRCTMCPLSFPDILEREAPHLNSNKDMSFENFKKIVDSLPYLLEVKLNGIGEPTLHPDFLDMVRYCANKGINVTFFTNATYFTEDYVNELIDAGVTMVSISIDGFSKETYERIRRGGDFEKVVSNIRLFDQVRRKKKKDSMTLLLNLIRTDQPEEELVALEKFAKTVNALFHIRPEYKVDGQEILAKGKNGSQSIECRSPWSIMYISIDGDINPCCFTPQLRYYNFFKEGPKIWKGPLLANFRKRRNVFKEISCLKCPNYLHNPYK